MAPSIRALELIVLERSIAWLRERLRGPTRYWTPAERRLGNAVAKFTEDNRDWLGDSFLVMPAKPKPRAGTRMVPRRKGVA